MRQWCAILLLPREPIVRDWFRGARRVPQARWGRLDAGLAKKRAVHASVGRSSSILPESTSSASCHSVTGLREGWRQLACTLNQHAGA